MVKARIYVVKRHFKGRPERSDYEVVERELPAPGPGELLVRARWVSVDPYMRAYNARSAVPYDQFGYQVGEVLESRDAAFPPGALVVSHRGWCDHYVANPSAPLASPGERIYRLPDLRGLPESLGVGAVGMPGVTAYFGFLELCAPRAGETVVVSGAAGAVGSLVGQIAKIKGCRVVGLAGSADKVKWLEGELGFDAAIDYKKADVAEALRLAAPKGVDCYFDNVGGELSSVVIAQMNLHGRVAVCGSISAYNEDFGRLPKATILQPSIVFKQLRIEGFIVWRWAARWDEALAALAAWVRSGQLKAREHVTEGFDKLFDAFVGMLDGENFGKAVVKV